MGVTVVMGWKGVGRVKGRMKWEMGVDVGGWKNWCGFFSPFFFFYPFLLFRFKVRILTGSKGRARDAWLFMERGETRRGSGRERKANNVKTWKRLMKNERREKG